MVGIVEFLRGLFGGSDGYEPDVEWAMDRLLERVEAGSFQYVRGDFAWTARASGHVLIGENREREFRFEINPRGWRMRADLAIPRWPEGIVRVVVDPFGHGYPASYSEMAQMQETFRGAWVHWEEERGEPPEQLLLHGTEARGAPLGDYYECWFDASTAAVDFNVSYFDAHLQDDPWLGGPSVDSQASHRAYLEDHADAVGPLLDAFISFCSRVGVD